MRNVWFDRSVADRRSGMRRAAFAAWAVVFVLFALVATVPGGAAPDRPATDDRLVAGLIAHPVQPADDACHCVDFDRLEMAPAPSMC